MKHGASLIAGGIMLGVSAALLITRPLSTFLYGVTATDPVSMSAAAAMLLGIGLLAALIPALRASRTDPARVLREQ